MSIKSKRSNEEVDDDTPTKKIKRDKSNVKTKFSKKDKPPKKDVQKLKNEKANKSNFNTEIPSHKEVEGHQKNRKFDKSNFKSFQKGKSNFSNDQNKPTDWIEFKKKKKELLIKRKQTKSMFEIITKAKQIGEKLRCKKVEGGKEERNKLVRELHTMLTGNYVKFVLAHDTARVVQYSLKFGNQTIREEISKELIPATVQMIQSKYGKFCIKRLLKYGNSSIRASVIKAMYGHAVKLTSHAVSAPIFEYAYTTWAQPLEKCHLIQEFFGDMYKQSKDDNVKHLKDVYKESTDMKTAALGATKANLSRIMNKDLLDSGLVQSVLSQFLTECSNEDRAELITQLAPHVVILSNSKDGARVVMQCVWNGTNKERKIAMKAIKEHVIELCKHEHGHSAILALLDATDDTVLLNKMIITEIINNALDIASDEWGRKVLLWLVAPADLTHFHPSFIKELDAGRENSTCKKSVDIRRKEILGYSSSILLINIASQTASWLANASIAVVALAVLKTGEGKELQKALKKITKIVVDPDWKVKENDVDISGIEHAGLHMTLKKLSQHDKTKEDDSVTFGEALLGRLTDDVIKNWITLNRGCFLLVAIFENGSEAIQNNLKEKLTAHIKLLKSQDSTGSRILLKKIV